MSGAKAAGNALAIKAVAGALVPLTFLLVLVGFVAVLTGTEEPPPVSTCAGPGLTVDLAALPGGAVAGYSGEQLRNAAIIADVARQEGLSPRGQQLGITAAMGESNLTNIEFGDLAGPDSRGLFQQREPWGPLTARMDPATAARMFFTGGQGGQPGLTDVPGWESLTPTLAIHRTQRNADPNHYTRYWEPAGQVLAAVTGLPVTTSPDGPPVCGAPPIGAPADAPAGSWVKPAIGTFTSPFGMRWGKPHNGADIGAPLGTPVMAAGDGVVVMACLTNSKPCGRYGTLVAIDHGGGTVTRYAHATPGNVLVRVGDRVRAGQQITRVGTFGDSTGPHLHFEVQQGGRFIDPEPFMSQRGAPLR